MKKLRCLLGLHDFKFETHDHRYDTYKCTSCGKEAKTRNWSPETT